MEQEIAKLEQLQSQILSAIKEASNKNALVEVRNIHLSKKAEINNMMGLIKNFAGEQKAKFGQKINSVRQELNEAFEQKMQAFADAEIETRLASEQIDISLPGTKQSSGSINPFYLVRDEILEIFINMGYEVKEGRDVETDHYNFELMNIPKNHPSRDMQD